MSTFDLLANWIRTGVAAAVGAGIGWFTTKGFVVDPASSTLVISGAGGLFTLVYQVLVTSLQTRWPIVGILLGVPRVPTYQAPADTYHPGVHSGSDL
ncbi:hypothetical protein ACOZ38_25110 [Sphaerisporangium viridialbum]|uniref:hypothetical protein n=1 Tax=Sphaerisporangium viridialbum TaxID=46189 RepID=UPI003C7166E2